MQLVNMVTCESEILSFRIFFRDIETAVEFAEWVDFNGFRSRIEEVNMEEQPRTQDEEQLAKGMWKAYVQWRDLAKEIAP